MGKQLSVFVDEPRREIDDIVEELRAASGDRRRATEREKRAFASLTHHCLSAKVARYESVIGGERFRIDLDLPEPTAKVKWLGADDDE